MMVHHDAQCPGVPRSAQECSSLLPNVSKCEMSRRTEVGPTAPLLSIRRYQLPLLVALPTPSQLSQLSCSAFSPSVETRQAGRVGTAQLRAPWPRVAPGATRGPAGPAVCNGHVNVSDICNTSLR